MQSVSDDDVRRRLLEKPRFELAANLIERCGPKSYVENSKNHKKVKLLSSVVDVMMGNITFYDFCCFCCMSRCMSPLLSVIL